MTAAPIPEKVDPADHGRALLSLQLLAGMAPQGVAPSDEELALLSSGRFEREFGHRRYQEVLSHLNADTQLLARWLEVREAEQGRAAADAGGVRAGLGGWLSKCSGYRLPAFLASAAVLMLAVMLTTVTPDEAVESSPSHQAPAYAREGDRVVEAGIRLGALSALEALPPERQQWLMAQAGLGGITETDTESPHAQAFQYGQHLTRAWQQCAVAGDLPRELRSALERLQGGLGLSAESVDCAGVRRQWRQAVR